MAFEDYFAPMATQGASGAATGGMLGGPVGAAIGGGVGLLTGFFSGDAARKQRNTAEEARRQTLELARKQREQRMADLQAAMRYFEPVNAKLTQLYGGNAAPPPFVPPPSKF